MIPSISPLSRLFLLYQKQALWIRFLINVVLLGLIWLFFYGIVRKIEVVSTFYAQGSHTLSNVLLYFSKKLLEFSGEKVELFVNERVIRIQGTGGVFLNLGCLGRNLMALFAGFILSFPSPFKPKLWYIPLGIMCICILNILRISYLSYVIKYYSQSYFQYNHHEIFNTVVYVFTFLMWVIWIKKYGLPKKIKESEKPASL